MNLASQVFQGLYAEASPRQFGGLDLSHWFSTRQVHAQEGSLLKGLPTWRYRVLRTALRLRPRRALSSASGQKCILAQNISNQKIFELFNVTDLTNHIPAFSWPSLLSPSFRVVGVSRAFQSSLTPASDPNVIAIVCDR